MCLFGGIVYKRTATFRSALKFRKTLFTGRGFEFRLNIHFHVRSYKRQSVLISKVSYSSFRNECCVLIDLLTVTAKKEDLDLTRASAVYYASEEIVAS